METKSGENESGSAPVSSRGGSTQIFICDASAEGGRLLTALQAKGYAIVDVPLGLLPSRVHYEVPTLIICDADALEAKQLLFETLEAAEARPKVALIGHPEGAMLKDGELREIAAETIARPLDLDTALEKVSKLTGPPLRGSHRPRIRLSSRAPLLVAAARKPYRSDGYPPEPPSSSRSSQPAGDESLWPVDSPPGRGPAPIDSSRFAYEGQSRSQIPSSHPPSSDRLALSSETQAVLEEGRRRVKAYPAQSPRPIRLPALAHSGGDEIRPEFIQALNEPLDEHLAGLDGGPGRPAESAQGDGPKTHPGGKPGSAPPQSTGTHGTMADPGPPNESSRAASRLDDEDPEDEQTNPGGKPPTQPPGPDGTYEPLPMSRTVEPPPLDDLSDLLNTKSSHPPASLPAVSIQTERPGTFEKFDSSTPSQLAATMPPPARNLSADSAPFRDDPSSVLPLSEPAPSMPASITSGELPSRDRESRGKHQAEFNLSIENKPEDDSAMIHLAQAIRDRQTGAVAQQEGIGLRRIVLTDGDISTVTSTLEGESLSHFLHARGDISKELLSTLGSIPGFGRHAGAALIARGLLQQEDLWPVLRSHAEWIMGRALVSEATTLFEKSVPARILEEPAVFGGAAGTEIYLETIRRIVPPKQAYSLLGAPEQVLSTGRHESLLGESALDQVDQQHVLEAVGKPIKHAMERRPELMPVLLALTYLGVLSTGGQAPRPATKNVEVKSEEMDDEVFAARVRARRALVDDGDYFSILGISRAATSYEVERAKEQLLAEFSDGRLTARTVHLRDDLALLRETIREAHLVLVDDVRRSRYRRALEAVPLAH